MRLLKRIATSPTAHVVWAVFVAVELFTAYHIDPYVFGFSAIILFWASVGVTIVGVAAIVFAKSMSGPAKIVVGCAWVLSAVALVTAFTVLRGFNWA